MAEAVVRQLQRMASARRDFHEMIDYLCDVEGFNLTGFNLIRVLMGAFAVNLTEAREVLAFFDSEMNPIASKDEINRQGAILIRNYAGGK